MQKVHTLSVELFHLTEPRSGYGPDNRTILRTISFGVVTEEEAQTYADPAFMSKVEPLFPLSVYSPDQSYREILCLNHSALRQQRTSDDYPYQFLQLRYSDRLDRYITNSTEKHESNRDPYFPMTGKSFVSADRRREIEASNPYVYGQYRLDHGFGCEHVPTNSLVLCTDCDGKYQCLLCHDEQELHPFSFRALVCCFCGMEQDYTDTCRGCSNTLSNHSCPQCKVLDMNDPEYAPYFHCQICQRCHIKQLPHISKHCPSCSQCYNLQEFDDHFCSSETESCPICQGVLEECQDIKHLPCSPQHKLHMACFEKLVSQHTVGCPLCRKTMIDEDQLVEWKIRLVEWMAKGTFRDLQGGLVRFVCNDCGTTCTDFVSGYCHACEGLNLTHLDLVPLSTEGLRKLMDGTSEDHKQLCSQIAKYPQLYAKVAQRRRQLLFFLEAGDGAGADNLGGLLELMEEAFEHEEEDEV